MRRYHEDSDQWYKINNVIIDPDGMQPLLILSYSIDVLSNGINFTSLNLKTRSTHFHYTNVNSRYFLLSTKFNSKITKILFA